MSVTLNQAEKIALIEMHLRILERRLAQGPGDPMARKPLILDGIDRMKEIAESL